MITYFDSQTKEILATIDNSIVPNIGEYVDITYKNLYGIVINRKFSIHGRFDVYVYLETYSYEVPSTLPF